MAVHAINSAGTAAACLVNEGEATEIDQMSDDGYTTLHGAIGMASNGDDFVFTDALADTLTGTGYTISLVGYRITCNDDVRPTTWGDGARINYAYAITLSASSGTGIIENIGRLPAATVAYQAQLYVSGTQTFKLSRVHGECGGTGNGFLTGPFGTASTIIADNNYVKVSNADGYVFYGNGSTEFSSYNNTLVYANAGTYTGAGLVTSPNSKVGAAGTVAVGCSDAGGSLTCFTGYYTGTPTGYATGGNVSQDATAPGSASFTSVAGSAILANATIASLDADWASRGTMLNYPSPDVSSSTYAGTADIDHQARPTFYAGGDYVPADASSAARPPASGYYSAFRAFGRGGP